MLDVIEETDIGVIEIGFYYVGRFKTGNMNNFLAALDDFAQQSEALPGYRLLPADFGEGSFWAKLIAVAGALGVSLGVAADSAQIAQFFSEVRQAMKPESKDGMLLRTATCELVLGEGQGRLEIRAPGSECEIIDRAAALAISNLQPMSMRMVVSGINQRHPEENVIAMVRRIDGEYYIMPDQSLSLIRLLDRRPKRIPWDEDVKYALTGRREIVNMEEFIFIVDKSMRLD